jgi:RNA recognition motif-containing protein
MTNIYVGNLSYEATEDDLRQAFEAHGEVSSVAIIMDKMTGRSRGFGFVEMPRSPRPRRPSAR